MESLKATDLRIGNTVKYANGNITAIQQGWELDEGMELYGIPLTEEWLDNKFGFEKIEPVNAKLHPYPDYVKDGVIIGLPYFEFTYNDGDNSRVLKYVHELMNLYYILTGEELEVKS